MSKYIDHGKAFTDTHRHSRPTIRILATIAIVLAGFRPANSTVKNQRCLVSQPMQNYIFLPGQRHFRTSIIFYRHIYLYCFIIFSLSLSIYIYMNLFIFKLALIYIYIYIYESIYIYTYLILPAILPFCHRRPFCPPFRRPFCQPCC